MNKYFNNQVLKCFLCGSSHLNSINYLNLKSDSLKRNIAYILPKFIANIASKISKRFSDAYYPVSVNKKYFNKKAVYCLDCKTGSCQPFFDKNILSEYYNQFYWTNRDLADGQHISDDQRPNSTQLELSRQRISWIGQYLPHYESVIDFGAGDCAAAYAFLNDGLASVVHVVDPSVHASNLANRYKLGCSVDISQAPIVDLIYSAHSLEHVHDLIATMSDLLAAIRAGGHIFIETPNIGDIEIFKNLPHTPHTFMLSKDTFRVFESFLPIKIIAMSACGPRWQKPRRHIQSKEKSDLRVLLQKISDF